MQTNLSFSIIFNQASNFIQNRFWQLMMISIIIGIFNTSVNNYFMDSETIELLSKAEDTQDISILSPAILKIIILSIFTSLIITSVNIATIYNLSINNKLNVNILLSKSVSSIIKVLGFNLIYTLIGLFITLFLSLIITVFLIIAPTLGLTITVLVILGLVFFMKFVNYFFISLIIEPSSKTFIQLFVQSHQFVKKYWRLGCLMMVINIVCIIMLSTLAMTYEKGNFVLDLILATVSNFIDLFVICFFYRLSQLISDKETDLINNNANNTNLIL